MIYAALFIYAVLFWGVTWRYPAIALMLIFAAGPFQNDLSSAIGVKFSFSFAEIHLLLTLPVFFAAILNRRQPLSLGPLQIPVAAYFMVCLLSALGTWRGSDAIISLVQMFLFLVVAVLLFSSLLEKEKGLTLALYGLIGVAIVFSVLAITSRSGYILGIHKNGVGGSLACALLVCLELWMGAADGKRRTLLLAALSIITAGLFFTLSRGAWLGAFCGIVFLIALRRQFDLLLRAGLVLIPLIAICWHTLPEAAKTYASDVDARSARNIAARYTNIEFARKEFEKNRLLGSGVGLRKQYDATNLVWLSLGETGVLGLLAVGLIHFTLLRMVWTNHKRFRFTDPRYSLLAIGGALMVARLGHGMVDHYWARGPTFMAWAAAGMATAAVHAVPRADTVRRRIIIAIAIMEGLRLAKAKKAL